MLAYAFRDLREQGIVSIEPEKFDNIYQILTEILIYGVSYRLKKGLMHNYEYCTDETTAVRGKINIAETINSGSLIRKRLVCSYDEYTVDTVMNRILKSVMLLLLRSDIKNEQSDELCRLLRYFADVSEITPDDIRWDSLVYNRNNREYRMLMSVCRIICENMLYSDNEGKYKLTDFDDKNLNKLYERFILNYYIIHHPDLMPASKEIKWAFDENNGELYPKMQSDIMLTSVERRLIIDAKFYSSSTALNFNKHTFHSHNLYQIFTYVMNESESFSETVSGMLLYARTDNEFIPDDGSNTKICGKSFYVRSLDLRGNFNSICRQLDNIAYIVKR